jgi:hypothetical protein
MYEVRRSFSPPASGTRSSAITRATGGKRGQIPQAAGALGVLVAFVVRNLLLRGVPIMPGDFFGYLSVVIAVAVAINVLR